MNEQSHPEAVQNLDVHFGRTWFMIVSTIIHDWCRVELKNMFHILYRALIQAFCLCTGNITQGQNNSLPKIIHWIFRKKTQGAGGFGIDLYTEKLYKEVNFALCNQNRDQKLPKIETIVIKYTKLSTYNSTLLNKKSFQNSKIS